MSTKSRRGSRKRKRRVTQLAHDFHLSDQELWLLINHVKSNGNPAIDNIVRKLQDALKRNHDRQRRIQTRLWETSEHAKVEALP